MAVAKKKPNEIKAARKQQAKAWALFFYDQYQKKKTIISKP
jgi:hypothetical protein